MVMLWCFGGCGRVMSWSCCVMLCMWHDACRVMYCVLIVCIGCCVLCFVVLCVVVCVLCLRDVMCCCE